MARKRSSHTARTASAGVCPMAIRLHTTLEKQVFSPRYCPSFQERSFGHSEIFQVLGFNSPAVCHQFPGQVPLERPDCRSTFSNPNPTPNTIARKVFTAPWHSLKLPTTLSNSLKIRWLHRS